MNKMLPRNPPAEKSTKVQCGVCQKRVKRAGLEKHMRDAHKGTHMIDIKMVVK